MAYVGIITLHPNWLTITGMQVQVLSTSDHRLRWQILLNNAPEQPTSSLLQDKVLHAPGTSNISMLSNYYTTGVYVDYASISSVEPGLGPLVNYGYTIVYGPGYSPPAVT